jgi:hypothetical protein
MSGALPNYAANAIKSLMSRENKGNRRGNNPIFFQLNLVLLLEHVVAKLHDFAENNVL